MKRIGIVTLNGYFNYGNRLQNYALQEALIGLELGTKTIISENEVSGNSNREVKIIGRFFEIRHNTLKEIIKKLYFKLWNYVNKEKIMDSRLKRTEIFRKFTYDYIKETDYIISDDNIPEDLLDRYDYFITGSDQVWNPAYNYGSSIYFLTFASKHKRIAYAPSFGITKLPVDVISDYQKWIKEIPYLSVREDDGAKIIKELTGRDALVLVDPTLLLTKEKWLSIAKEAPNKPKGNYLLTYFLGGTPNEYKKQIKGIIKENKLEVINLGDIREKETYRTGPSEFIDYINDCSIFFTDSFHGAVFSILLEKPFIVYERMGSTSMYSRIDTLLNKFELNSRKAENILEDEDMFKIDFSHVPQLLEVERKKSLDYLKNALDIKDENLNYES